MARLQLILQIDPPEQTIPEYTECRPSVEEKVRHAILLVDSGHESPIEWSYLIRLYEKLLTLPRSRRVTNLLETIHPVLAKFGRIEALPDTLPRPTIRRSK